MADFLDLVIALRETEVEQVHIARYAHLHLCLDTAREALDAVGISFASCSPHRRLKSPAKQTGVLRTHNFGVRASGRRLFLFAGCFNTRLRWRQLSLLSRLQWAELVADISQALSDFTFTLPPRAKNATPILSSSVGQRRCVMHCRPLANTSRMEWSR